MKVQRAPGERDLKDGESVLVDGSGSAQYTIKNTGGVYACSCPAWRNQKGAGVVRTCKHIKRLRGEAAELTRIGEVAAKPTAAPKPAAKTAAVKKPAVCLTVKKTVKKSAGSLAAKGKFAANVSLAHVYDPTKTNVEGWLLSEKLDGMRCLWHGGALWSRNGNKIYAPSYVLECLPPDLDLDGELFLGRGKFQECMSIVRRQDEPATWKQIRYVIFDAPTVAGGISKRLDAARAALARLQDGGKPHAEVLEQRICRGVEHVKQELKKVEALKGEGLMLRHPTAEHRGGRTSDLLKVKSFFDAEAVVLAHIEGTGKNKGRMGALECRNKAGKVFRLGTGFSEKDRDTPPLVGSVVTFAYTELTTAGIPRFPVFLRVRPDMDASDFQ